MGQIRAGWGWIVVAPVCAVSEKKNPALTNPPPPTRQFRAAPAKELGKF